MTDFIDCFTASAPIARSDCCESKVGFLFFAGNCKPVNLYQGFLNLTDNTAANLWRVMLKKLHSREGDTMAKCKQQPRGPVQTHKSARMNRPKNSSQRHYRGSSQKQDKLISVTPPGRQAVKEDYPRHKQIDVDQYPGLWNNQGCNLQCHWCSMRPNMINAASLSGRA